jgi:hypothetical protein
MPRVTMHVTNAYRLMQWPPSFAYMLVRATQQNHMRRSITACAAKPQPWTNVEPGLLQTMHGDAYGSLTPTASHELE